MNINPGHKSFLQKYYRTISVFILIFFLSFYPFKQNTDSPFLKFEHFDKIIHFIMYASLCFILFYDTKNIKTKIIRSIIIMFSVLIISGLIEIIQEFAVSERDGSIEDLIANSIGIVLGFFLFKLWFLLKRSNL